MKFKANLLFLANFFLLLNAGVILVVLLKNGRLFISLVIICIFNAWAFLFFLFKKNILLVEFEETTLKLKYFRVFNTKTESYNYEHLSFSNKKSLIAKGVIENVLELFSKEEKIFSLHPSFSGFSSEEINEILEAIISKNIPQIFHSQRSARD